MKIYYLSTSTIPSQFANAVHVVKMCSAFATADHDVRLFARPGSTPSPADVRREYGPHATFRLEYIRTPDVRLLGGLLWATAARRRIRRLGSPDLIYGRNVYGLARVASMGTPFVVESHRLHPSGLSRRLLSYLFGRPNFLRLILTSEIMRRDYVQRFPHLDHHRVVVAPGAADPSAFASETPLPPLPDDWPGRPNHLQVGYTGHIYPGKGMEIIAALAERMPHVDFHVVGGTRSDVDVWRQGTVAVNLYFHGHRDHRLIPAILQRFDVVLAPQKPNKETAGWTSPLKLFEYMAAGKAIVASDLPVFSEILNHGVTALLADPADICQWHAALCRLIDRPRERETIGLNAHRDFTNHYTWHQRARRVLNGLSVS